MAQGSGKINALRGAREKPEAAASGA